MSSRAAYLGDHTELVGGFEGVEQQDDILMEQTFQNTDLASKIIELTLTFPSELELAPYRLVMNLSATICPEPLTLPL